MSQEAPIISTPHDRRGENGNGKRRWWNEVWGKVVAGLLLVILTGILIGAWSKAKDAAAATVELYSLPPLVRDHEARLKAQEAKGPMPPAEVRKLAEEIADVMEARKGKRK
jgi:hypothetical protein